MPCVFSVKEQPHVQELLQDDDFNIRHILPVLLAGSDNSEAWRKFCREALNLPADQCFAHLTGKICLAFSFYELLNSDLQFVNHSSFQ